MGFLLAARKLLGLIPWWVWPLAALAAWGAYGHRQADSLRSQLDQEHAEQEASRLASAEVGKLLYLDAARQKEIRNEKDKLTDARLSAALRELRKRPDRLPAAAAEACKGVTGAELSRRDGEFLERLAARANKLRDELAEWHAWGDRVSDRCQIATPPVPGSSGTSPAHREAASAATP